MWFVWIILILVVLSILVAIIIIPVFGAWYTSSIILIVVGIIIIILGIIWYYSIPILPTTGTLTLTLNQDILDSRTGAILSIIFGLLLLVIGIIIALLRYYTRISEFATLKSSGSFSEKDCLYFLQRAQMGDTIYERCMELHPKIVKEFEIGVAQRIEASRQL